MRVAFFTPLPPEPTGIGDYSYELLEELRELVDVVAVVRDDLVGRDRAPEGVDVVGISQVDDVTFDCPVYQMGNNPKYHRYLFGRALDDPGLLVMHDPSLADFYAEMCWGGDGPTFRYEVGYDRPEYADLPPELDLPRVDIGDGRVDLDRIKVLMARRIISSNVRTLVNSEAIANYYRDRYPGSDVHAITLPAQVLEAVPVGHRNDGIVQFGVFGGINYYKRIEPVVSAFLELRRQHPNVKMVIAGRADDRILTRRLVALSHSPELEGSLEVRTQLTLRELELAMLECDVAISLRWPTAGEMSATLMRTLGAGRPSIVSDVLQFRELDPEYCWLVPTDRAAEQQRLLELMSMAVTDPDRCRRAGEHARAWVERSATYKVVAKDYVTHLEAASLKRPRALGAHRRRTLLSTPVLGVNVVIPKTALAETRDAAWRATYALRAVGVDAIGVELPASASPSMRTSEPIAKDGQYLLAFDLVRSRRDPTARVVDLERRLSTYREEHFGKLLHRELGAPHETDLYFVDTLCVDQVTDLLIDRLLYGRRIIVVLAPEALTLPIAFTRITQLADEIWVPNDQAATALSLTAVPPVRLIRWPSRPARPRAVGAREHLRILARMDASETFARSNPWSVIDAYRRGFPRRDRDHARLVFAVSGLTGRGEGEERFHQQAAAVDAELVAVDDPVNFGDELAASDVFVSLRRAEGFALPLLDALAAGVGVVTTTSPWGGVLPTSMLLTGATMTRADQGSLYLDRDEVHRFSQGQSWMEPNVERASRYLGTLAQRRSDGPRVESEHAAATVSLRDAGMAMREAIGERSRPRSASRSSLTNS